MTQRMVSFLVFLSAFSACKPRVFNESRGKSQDALGALKVKPAYPEDVVLELVPLVGSSSGAPRFNDGSVQAKVLFAPSQNRLGLKEGAVVRAKWNLPASWMRQDGTSVVERNVRIPEEARKAALDGRKRDVLPWALHGLDRVSALESLASARALKPDNTPSGDSPIDIRVSLQDASFSDGILSFSKAPVVVEGTHVALVRFDALGTSSSSGTLAVKATQFDAATNGFTARLGDELEFAPHAPLPTQEQDIPAFDPAGVLASPFNSLGWYVYGKPVTFNGQVKFRILALEPRAVTAVKENFNGELGVLSLNEGSAEEYFRDEAWSEPPEGLGFRNASPVKLPRGVLQHNTLRRAAIGGQKSDKEWGLGDKGLLVHVFSWRGKPDPKSSKPRIVPSAVTGHFAFGSATVVESPFVPGERKFDIDYHQVYGQGPDAIPAATQTWPAYMGSVRRGLVFQVPVSDFVVKLPDLTNEIGIPDGKRIVILDTLQDRLELLMALYRTGDGDGISVIDPVMSCVQDSNLALYLTYEPLLAELKAAQKKGAREPRIDNAVALLEKLRRLQTGRFANRPAHWTKALEKGEFHLELSPLDRFLTFVVSKETAIPRGSHDALAKFFDDAGASLWAIRTSQIGGGHDATKELPWAERPRVSGFVPDRNMFEVLLGPR